MRKITGEFDGFTYEATWIRNDAYSIHWAATVRDREHMVQGRPAGTLRHREITDAQLDSAVAQAVEVSIEHGVGVDRGEGDD